MREKCRIQSSFVQRIPKKQRPTMMVKVQQPPLSAPEVKNDELCVLSVRKRERERVKPFLIWLQDNNDQQSNSDE